VRTRGLEVARWISEHLPMPGDPSHPFVLTDEQVEFLKLFYAVDGAVRYVYRRALLQQPKGWGKSPLATAIGIAEFAGPVAPANPYVQIAAVSEEQADANVFSLVVDMLSANDGRAAEELGIDFGLTRLLLKDRPAAKLEAVTSKAGSREGQRVSFAILDESHLMLKENGGQRLARTIRRNAAKMNGRTLESANAFELGADSVAEHTVEAFDRGEAGILVVANRPGREPTPEMSDEELRSLLDDAYGDASWVDRDRLLLDIRDPGTPWAESVRHFFNIAASGIDAFADPARWADLEVDEKLEEKSRVALAFVGSSSTRAALVACSKDGLLDLLELWEEIVPRSDVNRAVQWAFEHFDVGQMFLDPRQWRTEAEKWAEQFGEEKVLEFPTTSPRRMAPAIDRFRVAMAEGEVHHDGDEDLSRDVAAARIRTGRSGPMLEEASPSRPIDAAIAAVLAYEAAATMAEPVTTFWKFL
jgi:phage terminase large subunit-like protein